MSMQEIHSSVCGHNKTEHTIKIKTYAEHRAIDFTDAYLTDLIEKGQLEMKSFKITGCLIDNKFSDSEYVYEVYYKPAE